MLAELFRVYLASFFPIFLLLFNPHLNVQTFLMLTMNDNVSSTRYLSPTLIFSSL